MSDVFENISAFSILLPLVIGLLCFWHFDKNSMVMFALILLAGIPQLAYAFFSDDKYSQATMILYNCYALADPLAWGVLFFRNIKNKRLRRAVAILPVAQIILWLYLVTTKNIQQDLFREMICFTSVVQVLWITVFFYEQCTGDEFVKIEAMPLFWFCISMMIYAPTTYFLFVFYTEIRHTYLWNIHSIINTLMYCIISIGFWVNRRNEIKLNLT